MKVKTIKTIISFFGYHAGIITTCLSIFTFSTFAQELISGKDIEISFPHTDISPSLYTLFTGNIVEASVQIHLPANYDSLKSYPLIVYVPGFHGGPKGNIGNAKTIAGDQDWIAASLPLFKESIDTSEYQKGVIIGFRDYPIIARAYRILLGSIFKRIPNINREKSAMVGFSNGAITIAVLLSNNDEFILSHFKNFCMVDQGMFHLTDLYKKNARDCRFLILAGDKQTFGREIILERGRLLQEEWKMHHVNLEFRILINSGHEFNTTHMLLVGKWLRGE